MSCSSQTTNALIRSGKAHAQEGFVLECIGQSLSRSKSSKQDSPDIQSVRISLGQNSSHKELTIVNVYDSPEHSSFKSRMRLNNSSTNVSTLDTLLEFSMKNLDQGDLIYLAGDFNARTASLNFELTADDTELEDTITLQDIFMRLEIATTEILAVRKYGEISQKPSHFGPHSK